MPSLLDPYDLLQRRKRQIPDLLGEDLRAGQPDYLDFGPPAADPLEAMGQGRALVPPIAMPDYETPEPSPQPQPWDLPRPQKPRTNTRLRSLVDAGPEALEGELRDFLKQAPPEDVADNPRAWWQSALEYLDLPRNAIANLVGGLAGVEGSSKEEFAGLRKIYGADFIRAAGWKPDSTIGKVGQFIAGLGVDFVMDPLTWLTGLVGVGRGTVKGAATTAADLAREAERARKAGKGLTVGGRHIRPGSLDEAIKAAQGLEAETEALRGAGAPLRSVAEAPDALGGALRAVEGLPEAATYPSRFGVGVGTHTARTLPAGHILAGPAIVGGMAADWGAQGLAGLIRKIPAVGPVAAKPLELIGRGIGKGAEALGRASEFVGTPGALLPEAQAFKAIPAIDRTLERIGSIPAVAAAGRKAVELGGKIGIGPGTALQQLLRAHLEKAQRGVREHEIRTSPEIDKLIGEAARATGVAREHLEPFWSAFAEYAPLVERAAQAGDEAALRSVIEEMRGLVDEHLAPKYPKGRILKQTEGIIDDLAKRGEAELAAVTGRTPAAPEIGAAVRSTREEAMAGEHNKPPQIIPNSIQGAKGPSKVIDLNLPTKTQGRYSQAYAHAITGSAPEASKWVDETLKRETVERIGKQLGAEHAAAAGSREQIEASLRARGVRGDNLLNALDRIEEVTDGLGHVDADGMVTLYHRTSPENARAIAASGKMRSKGEGELFFGTRPSGEISGYGDAVVRVKLPIESIAVNDVFGRESHFTTQLGRTREADISGEVFEAGGSPLIFVPIPSTSGRDNQAPRAIASKLAAELGGEVREDLLQTTTLVGRRAKGRMSAVANPRSFVAPEMADLADGARIVLVDDTAATGGTLRDATEALNGMGYNVYAAVAGRAGGPGGQLRATRGLVTELGSLADGQSLGRILGRDLATLTQGEAQAIAAHLRDPAKGGLRGLELGIAALRENPIASGVETAKRMTQADVVNELAKAHGDLTDMGLVTDSGSMAAQLNAAGEEGGYRGSELLREGYTFTHVQRGEAEALRSALKARGRGDLAMAVRAAKKGETIRNESGDDLVAELVARGVADPIETMADGMVAYAQERSPAARARAAVDAIRANPEQATARQKWLAARYDAMQSGDRGVEAAARGARPVEIEAGDLQIGDRFKVAGVERTVIGRGASGEVVTRDSAGEVHVLGPHETAALDAGSLKADGVREAVMRAIGQTRGEGFTPSGNNILGTIRESLPEATREAELARLFGVKSVRGQMAAIRQRIDLAMASLGESGGRGSWERTWQTLEAVEAGRPTHGLQSIWGKDKLVHGEAGQPMRLTPLGEDTLRAMRGYLAAGGRAEHAARLSDRIVRLRQQAAYQKGTGAPVHVGLRRELELKERTLKTMGRSVRDELDVREAAAAAKAQAMRDKGARPLAVPAPRDLFTPEVAAVVERLGKVSSDIRVLETAAKIAPADITKTTERGYGYWPRILGPARTVLGKLNRAAGATWKAAMEEGGWKKAVSSVEAAPVRPGESVGGYELTRRWIEAANKDRTARGLPTIDAPKQSEDLAVYIGKILDANPDLKPEHRFALQRTFLRESLTHEINAIADLTTTSFMTDPIGTWAKRRYAAEYAVAGADFLRAAIDGGLSDRTVMKVAGKGPLPTGFERWVDPKLGNLAHGYAFSKDLIKHLNKFSKYMEDPHPILKGYDWALSQWKTMVLAVFPYTTTNLFSGVFQANQFDAYGPRSWGAAKKMLQGYAEGGGAKNQKLGSLFGDVPAEWRDLSVGDFIDTLQIEHGVLGGGNYGAEMEQAVKTGLAENWSAADTVQAGWSRRKLIPRIQRWVPGMYHDPKTGTTRWSLGEAAYFKGMRAINVAVEDWMHLGFVLERMKRGDTMAEAAQKSRLALNQSSNLTDFEKATFRRLIPFWGWMKGNAVLQWQMAMARPAVTAMVPKIRGDLEASFAGEANVPGSLRPRHVAEEFGVQLTDDPVRPDFLNLTRMFPVKELGFTPLAGPSGMIRSVMEAGVQGMSPFLKQPLETAINRDLFWDRPINEYEGQRRKWLGMNLPPGVKRAATLLRPLNVAEQISWRGVPTTGEEAGFTAAQVAGVRTFPVDVRRQVNERVRNIEGQMSAVMRDFSRARTRAADGGRDWKADPEVLRLSRLYKALQDQKEQLPYRAIREQDKPIQKQRRAERAELRQFAATS